MASADMLPSSSSATFARRGHRTDNTTDEVSSDEEIGENRNRIRKKRSICHVMSSSLMIAKNRNRSSSVESLETEMGHSPSRRRRISEPPSKSPSSSEHNRAKYRKRAHREVFSSSSEPSRRQRRRKTVSSGSDNPRRKRNTCGSSKKVVCHHAEPTQSFTIKSNAPHLMSYETKQVISYAKCVTCGELTKSTHTELNVNLQTAQQQPVVNYVPIPVAVTVPLQHIYPQPVAVNELVQQSEEELGHGERMLMAALRRKITPH